MYMSIQACVCVCTPCLKQSVRERRTSVIVIFIPYPFRNNLNKSQVGQTDLTQSMIILFNKYHQPLKNILAPGSVEVKSNSPNSIFAGFQINTVYIYIPLASCKFYDEKYISYAVWKEIFAHHGLSQHLIHKLLAWSVPILLGLAAAMSKHIAVRLSNLAL